MLMEVVRSQNVPGLEQLEEHQRAVILAEMELKTRSTEISTAKTPESTLPAPLKSILKMSFQRLLSKLQLRTNEDDDEPPKFSLPLNEKSKEKESLKENSNYLDFLLTSYTEGEEPRSFSQRLKKPFTTDDDLIYDDFHVDIGSDSLFLYEDDSDIGFAMIESRHLDRNLRRFLHKLETQE